MASIKKLATPAKKDIKSLTPQELLKNIKSLTLAQIARRYPDTKAFSFYLGKEPNIWYFRLGNINRQRIGDYISYVRVLKMDLDSGSLLVTNLHIRLMDAIISLPISEFYSKGITIYEKLKFLYFTNRTKELKSLLKRYEYYSIKKGRKRP